MNSEEWLKKLIAFDTTSRNSNLPLIHCVADWFDHYGVPVSLTYDSTGKKANLFASIGGAEKSGIILSGHTDVVPVDGQKWETDPFCATKANGRIYGRGACDMKGFLAVALAILPELLAKPLHFAFSYDEEVGCLGAPLLIEEFQKRGIQPAACIVGEPTGMRPVLAHKGINSFRCRVHGHAAHSSLTPKGCNSIEHGAALITWLRSLADQLKAEQDPLFEVPFTTLSCNMISGGIAMNTIPDLLEFIFEFRNLPHTNPEQISAQIHAYIEKELLPRMREENEEAAIEIEGIGSIPAFEASLEAEITKQARAFSQNTGKVSYATEAGLFQKAGIPTIVCGPGNIADAHKANEYVTLEQLAKCEQFIRFITSFQ